jgi:DNA replication protein
MNVINKNGEVIEKVSLDPLYDRLALNKKTESNDVDIYALFEKELGRTLSSFEYEMINKWIENGISEDIIKGALKEAILNDVRNFKYIDKIVYEWSKNGIKKHLKEEKNQEEMFDYDWLDENE